MRMLSLLSGVLLAGCAGQDTPPSFAEPAAAAQQPSYTLATHPAYAQDQDPRDPLVAGHWPFQRAAGDQAVGIRSCAGSGHYQLIARLSAFDHEVGDLPAAQQRELAAVAQALLARAFSPSLLLVGHTDASGSAAYNQRLSEQRARSVANWLAEQGLPAARMQVVGYGESAPLHPLLVSDNAPRNRRVEVFSYLPSATTEAMTAPCLQAVQRLDGAAVLPTTAEVMQ